MNRIRHVLISRTDAIGDVVLTLPMAAYVKELLLDVKVSFLGKAYTGPVIKCSRAVDQFIDFTDMLAMPGQAQVAFLKAQQIDAVIHVLPNKHVARIAKQAGIGMRIGTTNRVFHWFNCNKLVRLSRKNSDLHEAQLNLVLLKPLGLGSLPSLTDIIEHNNLVPQERLEDRSAAELSTIKKNIIFHPRSNGSGAEWPLERFAQLAALLPANKYQIFITGSEKEKTELHPWIQTLPAHVTDVTGSMSLPQFIAFIARADGLIASGTGPLHVAAALGINTLGLFPSVRPIHPGRWAPLGSKAAWLESGDGLMDNITAQAVANEILNWQ